MKNKKIIISLLSLSLLAASCNPFTEPTVGGVVKTVNGGADWQFSNVVTSPENANLAALNVSKIGFDPQNREIVYVGGYNGGLYKSTDSGATWQRILSRIFVYDFVLHPTDSKTILVAGFFGGFGKILRTTDGGSSWDEIYNEAGTENPVRAIAINPENPSQVVLGTSSGNIVKSHDGGTSWKLTVNFSDRVNRILWQQGNIYVVLRNKGLHRSSNFAENFEDLTDNLSQAQNNRNVSLYDSSSLIYNQVAVDTANSSLIYVTTSLGLYRSTNAGSGWTYLPLPVKQSETQARAIALARGNSNIIYTSVGATIYKSIDQGSTWQTQSIATNGFLNYILIDPELPQISYGGIFVSQ